MEAECKNETFDRILFLISPQASANTLYTKINQLKFGVLPDLHYLCSQEKELIAKIRKNDEKDSVNSPGFHGDGCCES